MRPRHPINGEFSARLKSARFTGPSLLVVAGIMAVLGVTAGWFVSAVAMVFIVSTEIAAFLTRRKRAWIEVLPDGFIFTNRQGTREFRDHEIVSFAAVAQTEHNNGVPTGYRRSARLWPATAPVIELENQYLYGVPDPLAPLLDRIEAMLRNAFINALEHAVEVGGDGWQLSSQELRYNVGRREDRLPLAEIAAVEPADGKMCVWACGQELPSVQIPLLSRNAGLLPILTARYRNPPPASAPGSLGRVLFSRTPSRGGLIFYLAGAAIFVALAVWLALDNWMLLGLSLLMLVPAAGLGLAAANVCLMRFSCHERGVFQRSLFRRRTLRFEEVASYKHEATPVYEKSVYQGTSYTLDFVPLPGAGRRITLHAMHYGDDVELARLCALISQVTADRLWDEWSDGESIALTTHLTLTADALVYRAPGLLLRKAPARLPYSECDRVEVADGRASVFAKHEANKFATELLAAPNFFPGLALYERILHASLSEAEK